MIVRKLVEDNNLLKKKNTKNRSKNSIFDSNRNDKSTFEMRNNHTKNNFDNEIEEIKNKIVLFHDKPILLDVDVANFYGVKTREINQAVKNNPEKFPNGYIINLSSNEANAIRSKFLIIENINNKGRHTKYEAKAFTEKGLYMLATILKGERATRTTIKIIETFAKFKEVVGNMNLALITEEPKEKSNILKRAGLSLTDLITDSIKTETITTKTKITIDLGIMKIEREIEKTK